MAAVTALAELVISTLPRSDDMDGARQAFDDRREAIHKDLKKESVESLSRLQRDVARQLLRSDK